MAPRALILQDDHPTCLMLQLALERAGFECDSTDFGDEGLAMQAAAPYDAALIDDNLPDTSGFALMRELRARRFGGFIAYIGSSAYGEHAAQARALGAHAVFCYPLEADVIAAAALAFTKTAPARRAD